MAGVVHQSGRQGRWCGRGPAVPDERALQDGRSGWRDPGARRQGARYAAAPGHAGFAQGIGGGFRDDGGESLWHDAVSGAPHLPARAGRRIDALHPGPVVGAKCPGAPRLAEPERIFPRTAKAIRLGAGEPAPRAYPGPQPVGRHRASGGFQRAGDDADRRQCARRQRQVVVDTGGRQRLRGRRATTAICAAVGAALHEAHSGYPGAGGRPQKRQGPGHGGDRFFKNRVNVRVAPSEPDA